MKRFLQAATLATAALLTAGYFPAVGEDQPHRTFKLTAESPTFWKLLDREAKLTRVAGDFGFTEGPVWDDAGFLYVSDEEKNKIYRVFMDGRKEEVISLGDPDGSTYDRKHRLIDCASVLRAVIAITPDGKYTTLADHYDGKKFNSPNDVIVGPDGAVYFTDPTLDLVKGEKQEIPFQGVYRLDQQGNVRLLDGTLEGTSTNCVGDDTLHVIMRDDRRSGLLISLIEHIVLDSGSHFVTFLIGVSSGIIAEVVMLSCVGGTTFGSVLCIIHSECLANHEVKNLLLLFSH